MKPKLIEEQLKTLNSEEEELLASVENDEWVANYNSSQEFDIRKQKLAKAARNSLNKISNYKYKDVQQTKITIHIPQNDFHKIKKIAAKTGIHYQTWITNTLHRIISKKLAA
ncbi:Antitoxin [Candidatus Magnetomoraceae bacterium gMMP-15]